MLLVINLFWADPNLTEKFHKGFLFQAGISYISRRCRNVRWCNIPPPSLQSTHFTLRSQDGFSCLTLINERNKFLLFL